MRVKNFHVRKTKVYYGSYSAIGVIWNRLRGNKVAKWWVGTDALVLNTKPPGNWFWRHIKIPLIRLKARLISSLISEHYYGCDKVKDDLYRFGIKDNVIYKDYPLLYKKLPDKPVVMLYYPIRKSKRFKYQDYIQGGDVARELQKVYKKVFYFQIDSGLPDGYKDLSPYYLKADALVLTKRAVGNPRMQREAELNGLPVWYQPENPNVEDIITWLNSKFF